MLYYNFYNLDPQYNTDGFAGYDAFNYYFKMQDHGNGEKSRLNRVLLNHLKNKKLLRYCIKTGDFSLLWINNMADLKKKLIEAIKKDGKDKKYEVQLINDIFHSDTYETDNRLGRCEDGDLSAIRYYNHERNQAVKMKAGRFHRKIVEETEIGKILNDSTKIWLCGEEFTRDWNSYVLSSLPETKLHVDDDFRRIYSSSQLKGCFHSCMTDKGYHVMFRDSVKAKAAYLTDDSNLIIARCVIFTDVLDESGNKWRLAERQYSTDTNLVLQRVLIDKLIEGNYIDGYKQIGAACSDASGFVDNDGNSLSHKKFRINMDLDKYSPCQYMDSFKWYDFSKGIAYNYEDSNWDYTLDFTAGSIERDEDDYGDENYDSYHDEFVDEDVVTVFVHGRTETCDEDWLEDFEMIDGCYFHKDDVRMCATCGKYFVTKEGYKSDINGKFYCTEECLKKGESKEEAA